MKSKYLIGIVIILIAIGVFFVIMNKQPAVTPESNTQNVTNEPNPPQSSITPIDTNIGSAAGVDLSALGAEANESGLNSLGDGASDTSSFSSGNDFNSTIDSINNPIQ